MMLREWAVAWGIPFAAIADLEQRVGLSGAPVADGDAGRSEAYAQSVVRLEAAQKGVLLFRNNVGVLPDENGRPVRYGLANDSPAVNKVCKSGDLIGVRPVLIQPQHVGHTLGQFVSREVKAPGWHYAGTPREVAQLGWANLINAKGGDAQFTTGAGSL